LTLALEGVGWQVAIWAAIAAPAAAALLVAAGGRGARVAALSALPALAVAAALAPGSFTIEGLFLGATFGLDPLGRGFLALTAIVWLVAGIYALGYLGGVRRRAEFFVLYGLGLSGSIGLTLAADVVSFYVLFNAMTLASYGLVVFDRDARATRAARIYMTMAIGGDVLIFAGLVVVVTAQLGAIELSRVPMAIATSPQRDLISALFFVGFGVKAGALGVHMWLPLAHPAAPTPASAILSGAVIKAGLLGWLRFLPLGEGIVFALGVWVAASGLVAAYGAAVVGALQRDAKTVLAYSSVSQMGLVTAVVGVVLLSPGRAEALFLAAVVFALHHGIAKLALFLGVGVVRAKLGARAQALAVAGVLFGVAALVGLPLTSGAVAKKALVDVVPHAGFGFGLIASLLTLSSAATVVVLAAFLVRLRREAGTEREAPAIMSAAYAAAVLVLAAAVGLLPGVGLSHLLRETVEPGAIWSSIWPVAVGALVVAALWVWGRRRGEPRAREPGDLLHVLGPAWRGMHRAGGWLGREAAAGASTIRAPARAAGRAVRAGLIRAIDSERVLATFTAGTIVSLWLIAALLAITLAR
jgi:formate hydrogenlyase subunit 3/multisubunit Na+/H+ antiporter MnhD subunit